MKKIIWWIIAVVVVIVIIVATHPSSTKHDTFRIGLSTPLTGPIAFAGESYVKGLKAAQVKINSAGGINGKQAELIVEDNANDSKTALSSFEKLRADNPDIYLITGSVPAAAISPVADKAGIPLYVSMSFSNTAAKFQNQVSFYPTAAEDAKASADTMTANQVTKVAIVYLNTDYGQAILSAFKALASTQGISITSEDSFLPTDANFQTQLTKAVATKPQAIYVVAINSLPVIKQLKTYKSGVAIYTNNPAVSGSLIYKDPATFDGVYMSGYKSTIPGTPEFDAIRAAVGTSSPTDSMGYTAAAYDNLMAIYAVLKKDPDTGNFVKTFSSYGPLDGVNGRYDLTSRDISIPLYPVLFKNGVLQEVK